MKQLVWFGIAFLFLLGVVRAELPSAQATIRQGGHDTFCEAYTMGVAWQRPVQLHVAHNTLSWQYELLKKATKLWNDLFHTHPIVLAGVVDAEPPTADSIKQGETYDDNQSVVYFLPPHESYKAFEWGGLTRTLSVGHSIIQVDIFIRNEVASQPRAMQLLLLLHELGHALGLEHVAIAGSVMSYNDIQNIKQIIRPVYAVLRLTDSRWPAFNSVTDAQWLEFLWDTSVQDLWLDLIAPQAQDKILLMCLYDFETWGL